MLSVIVGSVMVNRAGAASKPPSEPVAVTVYGVPDAVPWMVTEQLNAPLPDTVPPQLVIVAPAEIVVVIVAPGVNPAPVAVTVDPVGPRVGASASVGVVIVNECVAVSAGTVPTSVPFALTV